MEKDNKNWDLKWVDGAVSVDTLSKLQSHQKINHFPGMNTLSRKNNLAKNMNKMQAAFPQFYNFIPKTFILPYDLPVLKSYYNESRRRGKEKTFIVKPEASCQGRGIFLSQSLSCICMGISEKSRAMGNAWSKPTSTIPSSTRASNSTWGSMPLLQVATPFASTSTTKDSSDSLPRSTNQSMRKTSIIYTCISPTTP